MGNNTLVYHEVMHLLFQIIFVITFLFQCMTPIPSCFILNNNADKNDLTMKINASFLMRKCVWNGMVAIVGIYFIIMMLESET